MPTSIHWYFLALVVAASSGCAFEQRTAFMHLVYKEPPDIIGQRPKDTWTLRVLDAYVPQSKASGLQWDQDGTGPDPFVRLYIDGRRVWQSPVVQNNTVPQWNVTLPRNIVVKRDSQFRMELWDRDTPVTADPIGAVRSIGLPPLAQPDAVTRLLMDNGAVITIVISPPRAHEGTGIARYEVHRECLYVLKVEDLSPASRAGIKPGEHITGVDGLRIANLKPAQSATLIALAAKRGYVLDVADRQGVERKVRLDKGFVWLTM